MWNLLWIYSVYCNELNWIMSSIFFSQQCSFQFFVIKQFMHKRPQYSLLTFTSTNLCLNYIKTLLLLFQALTCPSFISRGRKYISCCPFKGFINIVLQTNTIFSHNNHSLKEMVLVSSSAVRFINMIVKFSPNHCTKKQKVL